MKISISSKFVTRAILSGIFLGSMFLVGAGMFDDVRKNRIIKPQITTTGGEIHGFVYVSVPHLDPARQKVFLPNVTVYVEETTTHQLSKKVKTDKTGFFAIPLQPSGTYRLHFQKTGFNVGTMEPITVTGVTAYPLPVEITPGGAYVYGRVRMLDGAVALRYDPVFNLDVKTVISLNPNSKIAPLPTPKMWYGGAVSAVSEVANAVGDYVIPVARKTAYTLKTYSGRAQVTRTVSFSTTATRMDFTLPNANPRIKSMHATQDGKGVRHVVAGSTVYVVVDAEDVIGKPKPPLQYQWWYSDSASGQSMTANTSVPEFDWKLQDRGGLHALYVLVRDLLGGVATQSVTILTNGLFFSGKVVDASSNPVVAAAVLLNNQTTTTDANGAFTIAVPSESTRYVLSISKDGFETISRVFQEENSGTVYTMVQSQVFSINPLLNDSAMGGMGEKVTIPPNSLVDSGGVPAVTPLNLYLSLITPNDSTGRFPGDYSAIDSLDQTTMLESYGAIEVNIRDNLGNPYNLGPGKTATIQIPIDPVQLAGSPPSTISLWYYDTQAGVWREDGSAVRSGNFYVGTVSHFSIINADVAFSSAACKRLLAFSTSAPFDIKITVPTGTGVDKIFIKQITDPITALLRLPINTNITIEALDLNGNTYPGTSQVVSTGPATPSALDLNLPYPYDQNGDCGDVILSLPVPPDQDAFLKRHQTNDATEADDYLAKIDPLNEKTDLDKWKQKNFFDDGGPVVEAVYYNAGDLGFGRWMRMRKKSNDQIAYYVSNHGFLFPNNVVIGSADITAQAKDANNPSFNLIATVAMEYSRHPSFPADDPYIKFYVFGADGKRLNAADLDGRGAKFSPGLCVVCHGGTKFYSNGAKGDLGSLFLPFDLGSFGYPSAYPRSTFEDEFKAMNAEVLSTTVAIRTAEGESSPAIKELIEGWYGGAGLPNATQNDGFVPAGWLTPDKSALYTGVIRPSCRACHITRSGTVNWANSGFAIGIPGFNTYGSSLKYFINSAVTMPNALVTHHNFWLSNPSQYNILDGSGLSGW